MLDLRLVVRIKPPQRVAPLTQRQLPESLRERGPAKPELAIYTAPSGAVGDYGELANQRYRAIFVRLAPQAVNPRAETAAVNDSWLLR